MKSITLFLFILLIGSNSYSQEILFIGDSHVEGMHQYFDSNIYSYGVRSSGLCRPDFYNWDYQLKKLIDKVHPKVVYILLGTNDNQSIRTQYGSFSFMSDKWKQYYKKIT